MRYGSVCSGIEAASVAWHPLGWEPAFFAEVAEFPSAVLAHHYPSVRNYGDFTKIGADAGPVDLLVGGTPCQSFSVAGKRAGLGDPRGVLAFEFVRLAGRLRPRWLVFENVPGLLSSDEGRDFGAFLGALADVGYGFAYRVLDAQFFGLAQRRERVFVVGHLGDWRRAAAVLLEPSCLRGDPPPRREAGAGSAGCAIKGAAIGRQPENGPQRGEIREDGSCYTLNTAEQHGVAIYPLQEVGRITEAGSQQGWPGFAGPLDPMFTLMSAAQHGIAATLNSGGNCGGFRTEPGEHLVACDLAETLGVGANQTTGFQSEVVGVLPFDPAQVTSNGNYSAPKPGDPCHPLAAGSAGVATVAFHAQARPDEMASGDPSVSWPMTGSQNAAVARGAVVRRLTPVECARLQGFPDDYLDIPYRGKPATDGHRYRSLGNSMAVPVMRWLGQRIALVDSIRSDDQNGSPHP